MFKALINIYISALFGCFNNKNSISIIIYIEYILTHFTKINRGALYNEKYYVRRKIY